MDPKTKTDRYILDQVTPSLGPQERVILCAYLVAPIEGGKVGVFISAATSMAAFAVLTDQRLLLIQTRIGAFEPLLENHGLIGLQRSGIQGAYAGRKLILELSDGRMLEYQDNRSSKHVSTQREFFERAESTFGRSRAAASRAGSQQAWSVIGTVVGVALAVAYVLYRIYGR
jgi:hypothetical protein